MHLPSKFEEGMVRRPWSDCACTGRSGSTLFQCDAFLFAYGGSDLFLQRHCETRADHCSFELLLVLTALDQTLFFTTIIVIFFLILPLKHTLWYALEAPHRGASNEYPQHMFSRRNKKNIFPISPLIKLFLCTCMMQAYYLRENI